jgi:hypothetical protein
LAEQVPDAPGFPPTPPGVAKQKIVDKKMKN